MTHPILTDTAASLSELKANPMKVVASGRGMPVVVLNRNAPVFYCIPAGTYEALMETVDEAALIQMVKARENEPSIKVSLDDL